MAKSGRLDETDIIDILSRYEKGESMISIGKCFKVSAKSVEYHAKKRGVYDPDRGKLSDADRAEIIDMYKRHIPLVDIASRFGVTDWTISHWIKKWGIPLAKTMRTKVVNRNNVTELDVVAKYRELESVNKTAKHFNTSDVTIAKILKRHGVEGWRDQMRVFLDENKDYVLERYRDGFGVVSIARELNISYSTLYLNMRRWGIARSYPRVKEIRRTLETDKAKIHEAYFDNGVCIQELAETYEISRSRMHLAFKEWGWKARNPSRDTSIERIVEKMLKQIGVAYAKQFKIERRLYDFFVPSANLLIEVHGDYWHGNPRFYRTPSDLQKKNRNRDRIKTSLAKANRHRLVCFWECEINQRPERVRAKIEKALRLDTQPQVS